MRMLTRLYIIYTGAGGLRVRGGDATDSLLQPIQLDLHHQLRLLL